MSYNYLDIMMKNEVYMIKKMKRYILVALSTLFAGSLLAQSEQKGLVMEYQGENPKTPLGNVSVSAKGASATISAEDGSFTLQFRTLHAGDVIEFRRIELFGYEVMNKDVVDNMKIGNAQNDKPLVIVLCKSEELQKIRDGYRDVASQHYEKQLKEKQDQLEQLRKEGKIKETEYQQQISSLEDNYEQQLQNLDTYVDKFARIDLSELDEFEKEIMELVKEGRFEEAIAKYDEQDLTTKLQEGVKRQQQLQQDQQLLDSAIQVKDVEIERLDRNIQQMEKLKKEQGK